MVAKRAPSQTLDWLLEGQGREFGDPYTRTVATMRYVADNFTDEKVKQTMLRLLAIEYMQNNGVRNTAEFRRLKQEHEDHPRRRSRNELHCPS